jgi:hypothetical protein
MHRFWEIILSHARILVLLLPILLGCASNAQAQTLDFSDHSGFGSASSTMVSTIKIGALTDAEAAITANATATGDDITGSDDEDGVSLPLNLVRGQSNSLTVNVSNSSGATVFLNVWIDFNGNGILTDSGEQVASNQLVATGVSGSNRTVTFTVPATALLGRVGVRTRLTSTSSPVPTGLAGNGEVEDHVVTIFPASWIQSLMTESRINTNTAGDQLNYVWSVRTVAVQPDGSYITVWIDTGGADGQARGIYGQRFDAAGNRLGSEFQVNTKTSGSQDNPTIAVAPDGSFVVGWDGPGNSTDTFAQRFSPSGERVGDEFLLNTTVSGNQQYPELCYFPDGTFVAAFVDANQTVLQRFDTRARRIGQETRISSAAGSVVMDSLCVRPDNTVLLTWTSAGDVYGQLFSSTLSPMGAEVRFNQYTTGNQQYSGARVDSRGNIVVVWQSDGQDGAGEGVYGRRYDSTLNPLGNEFAITTNTVGNQYEPQVAVSPSGLFVVSWTDYDSNRDGGGGTPSSSVWMRLYDTTGTAIGSEMMVNQSIAGYQGFPVIAMNDSGRLIVVWEGNGTQVGQIDSYGVFSRAFQLAQTGTTAMSVTPSTATAGDLVTVTMTLTAPTSIANVIPNPLSVEGTNGVSATLVSGPSPASATVGTSGTIFTWTYRITARNQPGVLNFGGNADNDANAIFPFAETAFVSVRPSLYIRDLTAANIVGDSNVKTAPGAGPNAFTIGARVSNQGLSDLNDVILYLGDGTTPAAFPVTSMSLVQTNNTYQGDFSLRLLAASSDATRPLAKLGRARNVIAGGIDFDGNGSVGAEDNGTLSNGMNVISGRIDLNRDGLVNSSDSRSRPPGRFDGYVEPAIINGYVDASGDGVINNSDADTYGGEVAHLYWHVAYDTVDAFNNPTFGNSSDIGDDLRYDWTIWGVGESGGTTRVASLQDSAQVRSEQSAAANKVVPSPNGFVSGSPPRIIAGRVDINSDGSITTTDDGAYFGAVVVDGGVDIDQNGSITTADDGALNGFTVIDGRVDASGNGNIGSEDDVIMVQIGQTFQITLNNATFGTVGGGYDSNRDGLFDYDMWYQPVGEPDFNANSFRLLDIQANITGSGGSNPLNGITTSYSNEPYLSRLIGDVSGGFNATYTYTWIVTNPGRTVLSPYHQAGSGTNNVKYSGDYGINVVATTGTMGGISLTKSGGPDPTPVNGTTTWTMNYQNISNSPIGYPSNGNAVVIEDSIPTNTTFVANSATSATYPTLVQYSTDNGLTWSINQPAAASVNRLRWLVDQAIPVAGAGSVSFQTTVNSGTPSETNIPNQAIVRIGDGPAIATANASVTVAGNDFGDLSLFAPANSVSTSALKMGQLVDVETSSAANASARGDDLDGVDDEDGVTLPASVLLGSSSSMAINVTNTTGSSAFLNVWIDFNRNGVLTDAGEQVAANTLIAAGTSNSNRTVNFTVPATASPGLAGVRVRLTSTSSPGPTGASGNGEVEDLIMTLACPVVTLSPATLTAPTVGTAYSQTLNASGSTTTFTYAVSSGTLPAGLGLDTSTGVLSGTPTSSAAATFTITATAANGCNGSQTYTITPVCPTITLAPTSLSHGITGIAYNQIVTGAGGTAPYVFAISSGSMPAGISLNADTGVLSGTPTSTDTASFVLRATDANGCTGTAAYTVSPEPSLDYGDYSLFGSASSMGYTTVRMGASIDKEGSQSANASATGDDGSGVDDEDGVTVPTSATPGETQTLVVNVTNTNGTSAYLNAWIDFNHNGILTEPGEQITSNQTVANGVSNVNRYLSFVVPANAYLGDVGVRVRITSTANPGPTGASGNGEVEDHLLTIVGTSDFGDAASLGSASSTPSASLLIGATVDAEQSATTNALATGDDLLGVDDEDGVMLPSFLQPGAAGNITVNVTNTTSLTGFLNIWADWNGNGMLTDAGEQIAANVAIAPGTIGANRTMAVNVPSTIALGSVPLRTRLTNTSTTLPIGPSGNGEVEDHYLAIDGPIMGIGNLVFVDDNGNKRFDLGEGRDGVIVELYRFGDTPGATPPVASTITENGGRYLFSDLWQGQYFIHLPAYQFEAGGNLRGFVSVLSVVSGDDNTGQDALPALAPWITGVSTSIINLVRDHAPADTDTETGFNASSDEYDDMNIDLTIDVGLFRPVALGNLVFVDTNSNGHHDNGEGMPGVRVELYSDTQFPGLDNPLSFTTTDSEGRYGFNLLSSGNYVVHIPATEFQFGGALYQHISILEGLVGDDDAGEDGINNGDPTVNGISSLVISIYPGTAPTNDSGETGFDYTADDQADASVDLTIDFGFQTPVGLGNLVYVDSNQNGIADAGEGIAGVTVELYRSDQAPGSAVPIFTQITSGGGSYFFNVLPSGSYIVHIPYTEFEPGRPLNGMVSATVVNSSTSVVRDDNVPDNDNGTDDPAPFLNGISSAVITLAVDSEPTDTVGEDSAFNMMDSFDDNNFDLTIDFAFTPANPNAVGVGNLVFMDLNGNGVHDNGEGIDGVKVQLFDAAANPLSSAPLATLITSGGGGYMFGNLNEGDYKLFIPPSEFAVGKPLAGWSSLPGAGGDNGVDDNLDENGIDMTNPSTIGVATNIFHLSPGDEPTDSLGEFGYKAFMDDGNDANIDLSVDFGFFRPVAVGNLVFKDSNSNGRADAGEGIAGVTLEIYREGMVPPFDAPVATVTTATDGSYLFNALTPDRYYIRVPETQFAFGMPLYNLTSVFVTQQGDDNLGEDGIDDGHPAINGIKSAVFALDRVSCPSASQEGGYVGSADDMNDAAIDLTIDFGFVQRVGIGNLVFNDANNDGKYDPNVEIGMDGVTVELWSNQTSASTAVTTTTTANGGLYNFTVAPGIYYIRIPAANFAVDAVLANHRPSSPVSTSGTSYITAGDDDTKQDGYTTGSLLTDGVRSALFTILPSQAPTASTTETGYLSESDDFDDANVDLTVDFGLVAVMGSPAASKETRNLLLQSTSASGTATFALWQKQNSLGGLNGPNDDADADGQTNLLEYALGTAADCGIGALPFSLVNNSLTGFIDAVLTRPSGLHADLRYILECSHDLITWTTLELIPTLTSNADNTVTASFNAVDSAFKGATRGLLRIRVTLDSNLDGLPEASATTGALAWARMHFNKGYASLSMPLLRPAIFSGRINSVNGSFLALDVNGRDLRRHLLDGEKYYVTVLTGKLKGRTFDIDRILSDGVSIALSSALDQALSGANVNIHPHWTLDSLLPANTLQSAMTAADSDRVMFFDSESGQFKVYWPRTDITTPGWAGNEVSTKNEASNQIIPPQAGMLVQIRGNPATFAFIGEVNSTPLVLPSTTGTHLIGTSHPLPLSAGALQFGIGSRLLLWEGDATPGSASYRGYLLNEERRWIDESSSTDVTEEPLLDPLRASFIIIK